MLTCVICGEELLLEEDMKTHLLLSHLEDEMNCPLCSLSGVSYDDLTYHISTAHPEGPAQHTHSNPPPGSSSGTHEANWKSDAITAPSSSGERTHSHRALGGLSAPGRAGLSPEPGPVVPRSHADTDAKPEGVQHRCPVCDLVCSSSRLLQGHVEAHLQTEDCAEGGGGGLACPVCSALCGDTHALQSHVDRHFGDLAAGADALAPVSPGADLRLARQLQAGEDERRRVEEAKREAVEFKKLKEQFGLDGGGGYLRQLERRMERAVARGLLAPGDLHRRRAEAMEALASGLDDGATRTQGTLAALCEFYQRFPRGCARVWLSADTDHYNSSEGDEGWGCGYRNLQMLLSALSRTQLSVDGLTGGGVPSVPGLQRMIEGAWEEGLDPQGASHFSHRLQGTRAWIGATEAYALLTSLGLRARITDFHRPTGPGDTHPRLLEWVRDYFSQTPSSARLPPRVVKTSLPPLYLQHQGHSRSIVGVEQRANGGLCLLLLDPDGGLANARKLLGANALAGAVRGLRHCARQLKQRQYQVVAVGGALTPEEKQVCIQSSRTLRVERIP